MSTISQQIDDYITDNGGGSVRDALNACMAKAQDVANKYEAAKARIERLENALMDALDQNGYSLTSSWSDNPQWVDSARAAIDWRGSSNVDRVQEMATATPERLHEIMQNALHSEYMRPCDERP